MAKRANGKGSGSNGNGGAHAKKSNGNGGSHAKKPNILIILGDDIGWFNISAYNMGIMGYRTPNIDRIAKEGALFTDWYGQQSCTAGVPPSSPASRRSAPG